MLCAMGGLFPPYPAKIPLHGWPHAAIQIQKGGPWLPVPKGSPVLHPQRGSLAPCPQRGPRLLIPKGSPAPHPQRGPPGAHHGLVGIVLWVPRCSEHPWCPVRCSRGAGDAEQLCPRCRRRFEQAAFFLFHLHPHAFLPRSSRTAQGVCLRSCFRSPAGCCLASLRGCPTGAQGLRSTNGAFIPRC